MVIKWVKAIAQSIIFGVLCNIALVLQADDLPGESQAQQVLRIGASADISKSAKNIGVKIKNTLTKLFDEINSKGGARGVTFQYIFLDDEYNPVLARQNFSKLVNELNTDILLSPFGTATLQESFNLANEGKLAVFFPASTESKIFRKAEDKNFISLSASYYDQGKALVDYVFEKKRPEKIALFYQDDEFGRDGLKGAKEALLKNDFKNIIELPYERNQADFSAQIKTLKSEQPDAIGIFSVPLLAKEFIKNLGAEVLSKTVLFGISDLRDADLLNFIKDRGLSFIYANSLPDWQRDSIQLSDDYKSFCQANNITPDPFSFEAYVIGRIFLYLVEQVKGPVTKEKLMQAAETIKDVDFKGLKLNFDPEARVLLDAVWIAENNDKPWVKVQVKK